MLSQFHPDNVRLKILIEIHLKQIVTSKMDIKPRTYPHNKTKLIFKTNILRQLYK